MAMQASGQAAGNSSTMTIQGCLQYTGHQYKLTESNGTAHELSGAATKLKPHVGHEIEVTGTEGTKTTSTTMQGGASSAKEHPVFHVTSVKHLAETCTSGK